jgi:multidrug efflux system membrane fusion protein
MPAFCGSGRAANRASRGKAIEKMDEVPTPPVERDAPVSPRSSRRVWPWLVLVLAVVLAVFAYRAVSSGADTTKSGKGAKGAKGADTPATPVVAVRARKGDINVYFTGLGAVTPIYTVTVRSRVDGELLHVNYREGDSVNAGDPLIDIDPRPFMVQLTQAEGQMARDQALLANARVDLARYETLLKQNAIQEQQVATQRALVAQDEGIVKIDQGQIDSAHLNLTYCKITAPITGRIGLRLVDPGNIVHASDATGLLVITQMQPISVLFTISEDQLSTVLGKLRARQTLQVDAFDREMQKIIAHGSLTTVDNEIDQTTGTVRLRATFDNKDLSLFPNQFVNARMLVETKRGVVLLPSASIQRTSNSAFVYVVKPDSTVAIATIKIGTTEGDDSEITEGLQAGDVTVIAGADRLQEGSKVQAQIQGEGAAQPAGGAAGGQKGGGQKGGGQKGGAQKNDAKKTKGSTP